jgi:soluble lytic murein transglycosylase-like protein
LRHRAPAATLLFVAIAALILHEQNPRTAHAALADSARSEATLPPRLHAVFAQLEEHARTIEVAQNIAGYARRYSVSSRLAREIYEEATYAGIDQDLAFRLVRMESDFDEGAVSSAGAIGLTQVMLATAQEYIPGITVEGLHNRRLNLALGLRYLRAMLREHNGDVRLALAAYNRGPGTVRNLLAQGQLSTSAYERVIMRGYTGRGILE